MNLHKSVHITTKQVEHLHKHTHRVIYICTHNNTFFAYLWAQLRYALLCFSQHPRVSQFFSHPFQLFSSLLHLSYCFASHIFLFPTLPSFPARMSTKSFLTQLTIFGHICLSNLICPCHRARLCFSFKGPRNSFSHIFTCAHSLKWKKNKTSKSTLQLTNSFLCSVSNAHAVTLKTSTHTDIHSGCNYCCEWRMERGEHPTVFWNCPQAGGYKDKCPVSLVMISLVMISIFTSDKKNGWIWYTL